MSNTLNVRVKLKHGTKADWANVGTSFVPLAGEVIIYDDYKTINNKNIPGFKIGNGQMFLSDLPFVDAAMIEMLQEHENDDSIHFTVSVDARDNSLVFAKKTQ